MLFGTRSLLFLVNIGLVGNLNSLYLHVNLCCFSHILIVCTRIAYMCKFSPLFRLVFALVLRFLVLILILGHCFGLFIVCLFTMKQFRTLILSVHYLFVLIVHLKFLFVKLIGIFFAHTFKFISILFHIRSLVFYRQHFRFPKRQFCVKKIQKKTLILPVFPLIVSN